MGLVTSLDGFRGLGVTMLIIGHALFSYVESWVTVIDAFFVLSGFLITTLLIQEHAKTKTIGLKAFYWRRALRLFPSVWAFVGVWVIIGLLLDGLRLLGVNMPDYMPGLGDILADGAAAIGYVYHLFFPNGLYVINPSMQDQRTMWHLWTLGMEEWFYLGIAGTVLVCVRKNWMRQLGVVLGVGFLAIGIARWYSYTGFFQDDEGMIAGVRLIFLQRPDSLMLGVLLAIVNAHLPESFTTRHRRKFIWVALFGLVLWLVMLNLSSGLVEKLGGPYFDYLPPGPKEFNRTDMMATPYWFRFGHTLGAFGWALVLLSLARYDDWWLSKRASANWLQWMGQRSYTIYIWHALPFLLLIGLLGGADASPLVELARLPVLAAAAIGVSVLVYNHVEMPVMRSSLRRVGDRMSKNAIAKHSDPDAKEDGSANKKEGSGAKFDAPAGEQGRASRDPADSAGTPDEHPTDEHPTTEHKGGDQPDPTPAGPGSPPNE